MLLLSSSTDEETSFLNQSFQSFPGHQKHRLIDVGLTFLSFFFYFGLIFVSNAAAEIVYISGIKVSRSLCKNRIYVAEL